MLACFIGTHLRKYTFVNTLSAACDGLSLLSVCNNHSNQARYRLASEQGNEWKGACRAHEHIPSRLCKVNVKYRFLRTVTELKTYLRYKLRLGSFVFSSLLTLYPRENFTTIKDITSLISGPGEQYSTHDVNQ